MTLCDARGLRVLIVSNLDSGQPFGQFTRPFFLGRALARRGVEVGNVAPDCSRVDFGPSWSVGHQSARSLVPACRAAIRAFRPDVVWAHQNLPGTVAVATAGSLAVAADLHSLPSVEWRIAAAQQPVSERATLLGRAGKAFAAERVVALRASALVAAGEEVAEVFAAVHLPPRAPVVVPNGIPDELLDDPPSERPPPLAGRGPHAVAAIPAGTSASNDASLDYLREVARELARRSSAARLHVIGTEGAAEAGLEFHGFQPVAPWLDHCDAWLLPYPFASRTCGGARNKLLDGLGRAPRIVTTSEGLRGLPDAAGWPGVAVAPDTVEGFARVLDDAMADGGPTLAAQRAAVRATLSWEALGEQLERHLREAAGRSA